MKKECINCRFYTNFYEGHATGYKIRCEMSYKGTGEYKLVPGEWHSVRVEIMKFTSMEEKNKNNDCEDFVFFDRKERHNG